MFKNLDTDLFKDVRVKEYHGGVLQRSYNSSTINVRGVTNIMVYGFLAMVFITIGIATTVLAPMYVYMVYLMTKLGSQIDKSFIVTNAINFLKLKFKSKISYTIDSWLFLILFTILGLIYIVLSAPIAFTIIGDGELSKLAESYYLQFTMVFMIASSSILGYFLIPIIKKENLFKFMMYNFEVNFNGMLLNITEKAREVIDKNGKKSTEYEQFITETITEFQNIAKGRVNESQLNDYVSFLYTYLMSIKGSIYGINKFPVKSVLILFLAIPAVFGYYIFQQLESNAAIEAIEKNPAKILEMKNPSIDLQVKAILAEPTLLEEKKFSDEVLVKVAHQKPELIDYSQKPSQKSIEAVRNSSIKNKTSNKQYGFERDPDLDLFFNENKVDTEDLPKSKKLFNGIWEGYATQGNGASWNLKITLKNGRYLIDYPSLRCGGELELLDKSKTKMEFREKIKYNSSSNCVNNGKVLLTLVDNDDEKLIFEWFYSSGKKDAQTEIIKTASFN